MSTATRVGPKFQVVIPKAVREAIGLRPGDYIEARLAHNVIELRRKVLLDYDAQVQKGLAAAEADIKAGRVYGPFDSVEEVRRAIEEYKARTATERKHGARRAHQRRSHARGSL